MSAVAFPDHVYLVVLAGGSGTRFWPKSRQLRPKQLCRLGGDELTMIEKTLQRFDNHIPPSRRIIVTHCQQIAQTKEIVGTKCQHYIAEPEAKNTANALTLAALEVEALARQHQSTKPPLMISVHADHVILDVEQFLRDVHLACAVGDQGYLTLLGIQPTHPETGFGYIETGAAFAGEKQVFSVASFKEKPDEKTAEKYLATGRYFWNSGIFVWQTQTLLRELQKFFPMPVEKLQNLLGDAASFQNISAKDLAAVYASLPKIAIDHAVLELSENVAVVTSRFDWKDVGSWDALAKTFATDLDGNYVSGPCEVLDCQDVTLESEGPMIAAIGLKDLIVVAMADAVLVCPSDRAQDVKKIVENLQNQGHVDLL